MYDHDLGRRVDLELLGDVTMLSADVTVPLIVTTECLLFGVASEARAEVKLVATELFDCLTSTTLASIVSVSRFKLASAETFVLGLLENDCKDKSTLMSLHFFQDLADRRISRSFN